MIKTEISAEVIPFAIPNKVQIIFMDKSEYVDLNFLTAEKLTELCDVFRDEVFKKANRALPTFQEGKYYFGGADK